MKKMMAALAVTGAIMAAAAPAASADQQAGIDKACAALYNLDGSPPPITQGTAQAKQILNCRTGP